MSSEPSNSPIPSGLSIEQGELYKALLELDTMKDDRLPLAQMYEGALLALRHEVNPDRIAQAALSLREVIDHLPLSDGEGTIHKEDPGQTLLQAVHLLRDDYKRACKNSVSFRSGRWNGGIDPALHRYLRKSDSFFEEYERLNPYRKTLYESFLQRRARILDGELSIQIPPIFWERTIERAIDQWELYRGKLNSILHHGIDVKDFDSLLMGFESFVRFSVRPTPSISRRETFTDLDKIDDLIHTGEGND